MAEILKGHTFVPGEVVDPEDLNDLVDAATSLKGLIHGQQAITTGINPVLDEVLVWDADVDDLRRAKVQALPSGATSVGVAATPTSVFQVTGSPVTGSGTIHVIMRQQGGNKVLAAAADGSTGDVAYRALVPKDTAKEVTLSANVINCTLSSSFVKQLPGTATTITLHLNNGLPGQIVSVYLFQGTAPAQTLVHWITDDTAPGATIRWPGGTDPVMTRYVVGASDVYTFRCVGTGLYFGTFAQNFLP